MNRRTLILFSFLIIFAINLFGQQTPKLVVLNRIIQLESIPSSQDTTLVYLYKNEGDSPLTIVNMIPGCTCMVPSYSQEPLMPGDTTSFSVLYTPSHPGPFSQAVTIVYAVTGSTEYEIVRVGIRGSAHE